MSDDRSRQELTDSFYAEVDDEWVEQLREVAAQKDELEKASGITDDRVLETRVDAASLNLQFNFGQ